MAKLEEETFLQISRGDANRIETLDQLQRSLHLLDGPRAHGCQLLDGRHQLPVVVEVADDRLTDLAYHRVIGLHGELPEQMIRERRRRGERVFDGWKLFDLGRRVGTVPVVQIIAEEVLVVLVVPGVGLLRLLVRLLFRGGVDRLQLLCRHFLQQRVLDDLLIEQLGQLERRHRQQLDRLLQRRRQDQLLDELGV